MPIAKVKAPDGRIMRINAPADATPEQIQEFASKIYNQQQPEEKGVMDSIEGFLDDRAGGLAQSLIRGDSLPQQALAAAAIPAGVALDTIGMATTAAAKGIANSLPEEITEPIGQGADALVKTDVVQAGLQKIGEGAEAYSAWAKENPAAAATVGNLATTMMAGSTAAPIASKLTKKPAEAVIKTARRTAEAAADPVKNIYGSVFDINPIAAKQFADEGVHVSTLAITDNPVIQRVGSLLKGTFGSTRTIENNVKQTIDSLETAINRQAFSTGKEVTSQEAGLAIQKGIGNYIDKFQATSTKLYNRVGRHIKDTDVSNLGKTRSFLEQEMAEFAQEPNLQKKIGGNRAVKEAMSAISDAGDTGLRYGALRRYRTEIGAQIKQNVISGEDNALAKRVYGALTDDMQDLARSKGDKAFRAFNNANAFYKNGLEQIEKNLERYIGTSADPSTLLNMLKTSGKNGDFKIASIMRAVPKQDRPIIVDALLQKMGKNTKNEFSPAFFFKNYNSMSNEAKKALFGDSAPLRQSLDRLSDISKRLVDSGRFDNVSKSADNLGNIGLLALGVTSARSAIGVAGGSNLAARLLTNAGFARVLAKHASAPATQTNLVKMLKSLEGLAVNNQSLENDIAAYIGLLGATASTLAKDQE